MLFLVKSENITSSVDVCFLIILILSCVIMSCFAIYFMCGIGEYVFEDFFDGIISKIKKMKQKRKNKKRDKNNESWE